MNGLRGREFKGPPIRFEAHYNSQNDYLIAIHS
jgi:hypothetical protein